MGLFAVARIVDNLKGGIIGYRLVDSVNKEIIESKIDRLAELMSKNFKVDNLEFNGKGIEGRGFKEKDLEEIDSRGRLITEGYSKIVLEEFVDKYGIIAYSIANYRGEINLVRNWARDIEEYMRYYEYPILINGEETYTSDKYEREIIKPNSVDFCQVEIDSKIRKIREKEFEQMLKREEGNWVNLSWYDLRNIDLTNREYDLTRAVLRGTILKNKDLYRTNLKEVDLAGADLRKAKLCLGNHEKANFTWADLSEADLEDSCFNRCNFYKAELNKAKANGSEFIKACFTKTNLKETELRDTEIQEANLSEANLEGADLRLSNLEGASFRYANLKGANLSYSNLRYVDFKGADLTRCKFRNSQLYGANFELTRGLRFD